MNTVQFMYKAVCYPTIWPAGNIKSNKWYPCKKKMLSTASITC